MVTSKTEDDFKTKEESPYVSYSLRDSLYSRQYAFQDIWPDKSRHVRYDSYLHDGIWNHSKQLPAFVDYLRVNGYEKIWKVFNFYNLNDSFQEIDGTYRGAVIDQLFRTIDLYLSNSSRETIVTSFAKAKKERLDIKSFLSGAQLSFSANPWDIATMSMRGITSCMSWHNGHSNSLAGSILDPFCAVISLCTDEVRRGTVTTFGRSMIARCVVRRVTHNGQRKLLLERLYVADKAMPDGKQSLIYKIFNDYLSAKSGLSVLEPNQVSDRVTIPYFATLASLPDAIKSYRDSGVPYAPADSIGT
jgi:hypothetical protein